MAGPKLRKLYQKVTPGIMQHAILNAFHLEYKEQKVYMPKTILPKIYETNLYDNTIKHELW